jgi:hypothetical protein
MRGIPPGLPGNAGVVLIDCVNTRVMNSRFAGFDVGVYVSGGDDAKIIGNSFEDTRVAVKAQQVGKITATGNVATTTSSHRVSPFFHVDRIGALKLSFVAVRFALANWRKYADVRSR